MARKRNERNRVDTVPPTAGALAVQAYQAIAPVIQARVATGREAYQAGKAKLSVKGRIIAGVLGMLALAGVGTTTVNHVARPAIKSVASAALGPAYRIQCQLPSGNYGTCNSMRSR